jgi:hypothetical protein
MNVIFTDIDGVLNLNVGSTRAWSPSAIDIYDRICEEFDLKPVISSTWRTNHTKQELQRIFDYWGIQTPIYDYTPILPSEPRGVEIELWLRENPCDKWIVLDDNVSGITPYVSNVIKCRGWLGLTEDDYFEVRKILKPTTFSNS